VLGDRIVKWTAGDVRGEPLADLSLAFAPLAGSLPAEQAGTLAGRIVKEAAKTTYSPHLVLLSKALTALAGKLPSEQAAALAGQIVELASSTSEPYFLDNLAKAFAALAGKRSQRQVSVLVLRLARAAHRARTTPLGLNTYDRLLPLLDTGQIVEALKQPGCVGATRKALLKYLGERYKRSFPDVWELIDYLKQNEPNLDLDSPLQAKRIVPRAEDRPRAY
jgi:hypothetical protein